ncbi:MAG: protein arginine kinase [Phycisphaerae bacterium]|nr:protein arginine kinase [Phycisphaerae bacterium]
MTMKLTDISSDINEWFSGAGPMSDIVMSSRIRLARNLAGQKFVSCCSNEEKSGILDTLREVLLSLDIQDDLYYFSVDQTSDLSRDFLVERHLISRHHAAAKGPRGVVIAKGEHFTGMINEEDHLRIQVLKPGCQLKECLQLIDRIDTMIEQQVEYAFCPQYGYLTACPTNLGSGARISLMLHLPALKITGHIARFLNAAKDMNLAVRGLFGEGTEATSDLYQMSNQVTLGVSEASIIREFEGKIIPQVVDYEKAARRELLDKQSDLLNDKISRAMALLQNAHLISSQEALTLLSHLRLGVSMKEHFGASTPAVDKLYGLFHADGNAPINPRAIINRLFMLTLPAHLQINSGKAIEPQNRDSLRAQIIKSSLG